MNCAEFEILISAYADNETTGRENNQVRMHLNSCKKCAAELEKILSLKRTLSALSESATEPFFETRLFARIENAWDRRRLFIKRISYGLSGAVIVATIVVYSIISIKPPSAVDVSDLLATEAAGYNFENELLSIYYTNQEEV